MNPNHAGDPFTPPPAEGSLHQPLVVNAESFGAPRAAHKAGFRAALNRRGGQIIYGPWRTRRRRIISGCVLGALLIGAGVGIYLATRPIPTPDYNKDRLDRLFKFTLLTDEFNRLPVDERLELMGSLVQRLKAMDGSESLLMAAFASSVKGKARDQLMENASRLMIDTADKFALEYQEVPESEKGKYLEDALVRFVELGSAISGEPINDTREEIIADAKENAQRDSARARENPLSLRQSNRVFDFADDSVGQHASPQQRGRVAVLMRDMVRHLRGGGG